MGWRVSDASLLAGVQCLKGIEHWSLSVIGKDFRKMKRLNIKDIRENSLEQCKSQVLVMGIALL